MFDETLYEGKDYRLAAELMSRLAVISRSYCIVRMVADSKSIRVFVEPSEKELQATPAAQYAEGRLYFKAYSAGWLDGRPCHA